MKKIQILGAGCPKCQKLAGNAEKAAAELGIEYEIVKVTNTADIIQFGVMVTPALAIDGKVRASGKVLNVEEIKQLLI